MSGLTRSGNGLSPCCMTEDRNLDLSFEYKMISVNVEKLLIVALCNLR